MQQLLERLGNPHQGLKYVHVAGTNGKGSTCALLAGVLSAAGYRTGLYTSPHLTDFAERIRVNGEEIPHADVVRLAERVMEEAGRCRAAGAPLTEFEVITAMAFLWFREQGCEICVLETGLGGRCDATNVIESPEVTVITSISLDHTKILGDTVEQIAFEKSGILKSGVPCVCYPDLPRAALGVIRTTAQVQRAPLIVAPLKDLTYVDASLRGTRLLTETSLPLTLPLLGEHQMKNAAVVMACVKELRGRGWTISDEALQKGFASVSFPARMEVLSESPLVLLDGEIDHHCARELREEIDSAASRTKPRVMEKVFTVAPDSPRAMSAADLAAEWEKRRIPAEPADSLEEALKKALAEGAQRGVLVCGSLYLAGEARPLLKKLLNQA